MQVVREPIDGARLQALADELFGNLVKAVVDVRLGIMVVGGELHADEEAVLIGEGSDQASLWGIDLYPEQFGSPDFIELTR